MWWLRCWSLMAVWTCWSVTAAWSWRPPCRASPWSWTETSWTSTILAQALWSKVGWTFLRKSPNRLATLSVLFWLISHVTTGQEFFRRWSREDRGTLCWWTASRADWRSHSEALVSCHQKSLGACLSYVWKVDIMKTSKFQTLLWWQAGRADENCAQDEALNSSDQNDNLSKSTKNEYWET